MYVENNINFFDVIARSFLKEFNVKIKTSKIQLTLSLSHNDNDESIEISKRAKTFTNLNFENDKQNIDHVNHETSLLRKFTSMTIKFDFEKCEQETNNVFSSK